MRSFPNRSLRQLALARTAPFGSCWGDDVVSQLNALLAPLRQRVQNLVARAVVTQVDDTKKLQLLQLAVLDGETRDLCERFQEYGYTANPPVNSEAVVIFVGGSREHPLVVGVDSRAARK